MTPNEEQEEIINRLNALADEARSAKEKKIINRAKFLQELSYERELTQAEKDEFAKLVKENPDIEDALIVLSKTGFARPSNHTGVFVTPDDEQGHKMDYKVEVPGFAYTEDPDEHNQRVKKRKEQRAENAEAQKAQLIERIREKLAEIPEGSELTKGQFNQLISTLSQAERDELYNEFVADAEATWGDDQKNFLRELEFINKLFDKKELVWKGVTYSKHNAQKMTTRDIANVLNISHVAVSKIMKRAIHKLAVEIANQRGIKDEKQIEALENMLSQIK